VSIRVISWLPFFSPGFTQIEKLLAQLLIWPRNDTKFHEIENRKAQAIYFVAAHLFLAGVATIDR